MKMPMCMSISRDGVNILYRCYKLPGYGKNCPDKNTDKCYTCKFCKAEMSGEDAMKLLRRLSASNNYEEDTHESVQHDQWI